MRCKRGGTRTIHIHDPTKKEPFIPTHIQRLVKEKEKELNNKRRMDRSFGVPSPSPHTSRYPKSRSRHSHASHPSATPRPQHSPAPRKSRPSQQLAGIIKSSNPNRNTQQPLTSHRPPPPLHTIDIYRRNLETILKNGGDYYQVIKDKTGPTFQGDLKKYDVIKKAERSGTGTNIFGRIVLKVNSSRPNAWVGFDPKEDKKHIKKLNSIRDSI